MPAARATEVSRWRSSRPSPCRERRHIGAALHRREVRQDDARHLVEAEQMRAEHPAVAGDNAVLFVDQHRVGEAKFADRGGDLRDLLVAVRARVSGVGDQRRAPAPNNRLG